MLTRVHPIVLSEPLTSDYFPLIASSLYNTVQLEKKKKKKKKKWRGALVSFCSAQ